MAGAAGRRRGSLTGYCAARQAPAPLVPGTACPAAVPGAIFTPGITKLEPTAAPGPAASHWSNPSQRPTESAGTARTPVLAGEKRATTGVAEAHTGTL